MQIKKKIEIGRYEISLTIEKHRGVMLDCLCQNHRPQEQIFHFDFNIFKERDTNENKN